MMEAINAIIDAGIDFIEVTWDDDDLLTYVCSCSECAA